MAITANSINYENSQFTIMLDESAYNTNEGSGDLEVTDFALDQEGRQRFRARPQPLFPRSETVNTS